MSSFDIANVHIFYINLVKIKNIDFSLSLGALYFRMEGVINILGEATITRVVT
jgi:hypothetical protein